MRRKADARSSENIIVARLTVGSNQKYMYSFTTIHNTSKIGFIEFVRARSRAARDLEFWNLRFSSHEVLNFMHTEYLFYAWKFNALVFIRVESFINIGIRWIISTYRVLKFTVWSCNSDETNFFLQKTSDLTRCFYSCVVEVIVYAYTYAYLHFYKK